MRVLLVVESCGLIHRQLTPQGRPFIMRPVIARDEVIGGCNPLPDCDWDWDWGWVTQGSRLGHPSVTPGSSLSRIE